MRKNYNFVSQEEDSDNDTNRIRFESSRKSHVPPQDEYGLFPTVNDDIKINEICLRCQTNEEEWSKKMFNYKLSEIILYVMGLTITVLSLLLSIWFLFFSSFKEINSYLNLLKDILNLNGLLIFTTLYYFIIELVALFIDLIKFLVIIRIFYIFSKSRKSYRGLNKNISNDSTDSATTNLIIYASEDNKKYETIHCLKQRIQTRSELKHIVRHLIRIEVLINLYFLLFVIGPKIFGAIYFQFFLQPMFKPENFNNQTIELLNNLNNFNLSSNYSYNIIPNLNHSFQSVECDYENMDEQNECFYSVASSNFELLTISLLISSLLKLLVQLIVVINFGYLLVHQLINKNKQDEETMNDNYEKARQNILHKNIRAQIERNDKDLAENIFNLDLSKYSFPKRKSKKIITNHNQNDKNIFGKKADKSESVYDLTNNDESLNEEEKNAIDAIEKVNNMNDDGFRFSLNSDVPKLNTFKRSNF